MDSESEQIHQLIELLYRQGSSRHISMHRSTRRIHLNTRFARRGRTIQRSSGLRDFLSRPVLSRPGTGQEGIASAKRGAGQRFCERNGTVIKHFLVFGASRGEK